MPTNIDPLGHNDEEDTREPWQKPLPGEELVSMHARFQLQAIRTELGSIDPRNPETIARLKYMVLMATLQSMLQRKVGGELIRQVMPDAKDLIAQQEANTRTDDPNLGE